jgi:hypothetical protein
MSIERKSDDRGSDSVQARDVFNASNVTVVDIYESGSIDPVYQAKAHLVSCAIQQIGMGRYQVCFSYFVFSCCLLTLVKSGRSL